MSRENLITDYILSELEAGNLKKGDKIPSEYELADTFSVNKTTANKAVSKLVASGYLKRLRGVAGTIVIKDRVYPKGIICYRLQILSAYTFSSKLLKGAYLAAKERGYTLQYIDLGQPDFHNTWQDILESGASGVIGTNSDPAPESFPLPVIHAANCPVSDPTVNYISSENYQSGCNLASYLLTNGHKKPVILNSVGASSYFKERIKGIKETYMNHGIKDIASRLLPFNEHENLNNNFIELILEKYPDCSVIITGSDSVALKVIDYLEKANISVPDQISVTGYSNMPEYQAIRKITTVELYPQEIGFQACMNLIDIIEKKSTTPIRQTIKSELITGSTVS